MDFSVDGSDSWDSTPTQDIFIRNYFRKKGPSSDVVTKSSKKKKKHQLISDAASTSVFAEKMTMHEVPKFMNSSKKLKPTLNTKLEIPSVKSKKEDNLTKKYVNSNFVNRSLEKNSDICDSSKSESCENIYKVKNSRKKSFTSKNKIEAADMIMEYTKSDSQNINSPPKEVSSKRKKLKNFKVSHIEKQPSVVESNFKLKGIKNATNPPKNYLNADESNDSEDDIIRNELQNIRKRKLKTVKTSQVQKKLSATEVNSHIKIVQGSKNTSNPPKKCTNVDEVDSSEDEVTLRERQNLKKRKSNTNRVSQKEESENSEDDVISSEIQNLKRETSKTNKVLIPNTTETKRKIRKITKSALNSKQKFQKSDDSEDNVTKSELYKQKKNKAKNSDKASKIQHIQSATETKRKVTKSNLNSEENTNNSDDSEEDEVIRNELQNTRMFKKIQKLMKLAPHLNPNFSKDLTVKANNSSCGEVSLEDSSSQSDGDYLSDSDNEVVSQDNDEDQSQEDASNFQSEDSFDDQKDSSDSEEEDIDTQESFQRNKQEMPIQRMETFNQNTVTVKKPSSLMEKARANLAAAKFRFLNQKLYTESGGEAFQYFQENREEFDDYHIGYAQQVSKWPLNPVDEIIADLQKMKKDAVIADLGCGNAKIARIFSNRTVYSFDLVAMHKCVKACDISKVPLAGGSVDVVVFCLSLMGVNLVDYLREAYRILKMGGTLKIAEVESRIEDLDIFIKNLHLLGFVLERKNTKNKLFVFLDLKKVKKGKASKALKSITLRPCLYKKR